MRVSKIECKETKIKEKKLKFEQTLLCAIKKPRISSRLFVIVFQCIMHFSKTDGIHIVKYRRLCNIQFRFENLNETAL